MVLYEYLDVVKSSLVDGFNLFIYTYQIRGLSSLINYNSIKENHATFS